MRRLPVLLIAALARDDEWWHAQLEPRVLHSGLLDGREATLILAVMLHGVWLQRRGGKGRVIAEFIAVRFEQADRAVSGEICGVALLLLRRRLLLHYSCRLHAVADADARPHPPKALRARGGTFSFLKPHGQ